MLSTQGKNRRRTGMPELELFEGCSRSELRDLNRLCTTVNVRNGQVLCRQGEAADECFIIVDGRADVFMDSARVTGVGRGDLVGELALLSAQGRRTATIVAATEMTVLALSRREFASLANVAPGVFQRVLREATRRLVENGGRP